jgi:bacteriorhodopsin
MIGTGYFGETSINQADGATALGWIMFAVSMSAWFYILYLLYTNVSEAARTESDAIRDGLKSMRNFILLGWAIYPLGYFVTLFAGGVEVQVVRELVYNIADLVNKVGFGLVAVMAAKKMSDMKLHQAANA